MKVARYMPKRKLIEKGIRALHKELGYVETQRFLNMEREPHVESVKRHRQWQASLDKEAFIKEVKKAHKDENKMR